MELKNYQEDLVLHVAEIVLADRPDVEPSEALLRDVAAFTLNRLPARYLLSERGFTRLAAAHCIDQENGDGLKGLVEVLLLVNKAIDTIRARRKPAEVAEPPAEVAEPPVLGYYHNLPYLIGRAAEAESGKAVLDAMVTLTSNGKPVPVCAGWTNPYRINAATKGFYSFLPSPVQAKTRTRRFALVLSFEHPEYRGATLQRTLQTEGEFSAPGHLSSDRILNLGTVRLERR